MFGLDLLSFLAGAALIYFCKPWIDKYIIHPVWNWLKEKMN